MCRTMKISRFIVVQWENRKEMATEECEWSEKAAENICTEQQRQRQQEQHNNKNENKKRGHLTAVAPVIAFVISTRSKSD